MGSGIIWIFLIVGVIGFVALLWYTQTVPSEAIELLEQGKDIFEKFTKTSTKGDEITVLIPKTSTGDSIPVVVEIAENATLLVEIADKAKIQICYREDPNGCLLSGRGILTHPETLQPIIPYTYTWIINIECAEVVIGFDYCNMNDVQADGFTADAGKDEDGNDLGGEYEYVWHPSGITYAGTYTKTGELVQKGLYDVEVFIRSKTLEDTKRYEEWWDIYQIEMRP